MSDPMQNRTEVTPADAEKLTPSFQHLPPAVAAQQAAQGGEEMVVAFVPKAFEITLSDGSRRRVRFEVGNYPIPARFKQHYYLKANGVTFGDDVKVPQKPMLEGGADPAAASAAAEAEAQRLAAERAAAAAWPADPTKSTFKELGDALTAHGIGVDDMKQYSSTALRLAKVQEMIAAEEAAKAANGAQ